MTRAKPLLSVLAFATAVLAGPASAPLGAQQAPAAPPRQAAAISVDAAVILTNGWAFLAQNDVVKAGEKAQEALALDPRSPAAFALALEVAIARAGAMAGVDAYQQWIAGRAQEPTFVRRVALAILQEAAADTRAAAPRFEALQALADEGDSAARRQLSEGVAAGQIPEVRAMAARGDATAVRQLADALAPGRILPNPVGAIQALGESGSPQAAATLRGRLTDLRPEVRGAAVEALAKTSGNDALDQIKPLLNDSSAHVRVKAASALYRLGDLTGFSLLQDMAASESAPVRLAAAEALSSRPDDTWRRLVRDLTTASEPDVRLSAAKLAASFDPDLATRTLEALERDPNIAIREAAVRARAQDVPQDLESLVVLLRHADALTRVAAAAAVLDLTR